MRGLRNRPLPLSVWSLKKAAAVGRGSPGARRWEGNSRLLRRFFLFFALTLGYLLDARLVLGFFSRIVFFRLWRWNLLVGRVRLTWRGAAVKNLAAVRLNDLWRCTFSPWPGIGFAFTAVGSSIKIGHWNFIGYWWLFAIVGQINEFEIERRLVILLLCWNRSEN